MAFFIAKFLNTIYSTSITDYFAVRYKQRRQGNILKRRFNRMLLNPKNEKYEHLDPRSREIMLKTIEFFESKGKAKLKKCSHECIWYDDFIQFLKENKIFSTLLTPEKYADGDPDTRWDTLRICDFNEILGFYNLSHWYALQATFAQYILGSKKDGINFGNGRTYKDIDDYIDNKYGNNNYTTPSFKPLSIDVVNDPVKGKYVHLGLPTMQLIAKDLSNMSLGISNSANISLYPLLSINVPGLVFEGHGGSVNLYPHTGGGFDIEFDETKFYYFNQSMILGDSSWDGNPDSNEHNIQFNDFLIHSGGWDAYGNRSGSFYHPFEFNGTISLDIETEADGKTWLKLDMPTNTGKVYATLGQMKICGEDFGTLEAGQFRILDDFKLWVSGHDNTGFDAMLSLALESDELKYTYGSGANDYNNAEGLHISNTFTTTTVTGGDSNKKTWHQEDGDPSKWEFSGTLNLGGPVTITDWDSPSDDSSWPNGSITLNQPLTVDIETDRIVATSTIAGSLGIENVQLGGKSFGPILATGIKGWAKITLHNK
jgi:hypothetical protein